jgi:hypothetical protein
LHASPTEVYLIRLRQLTDPNHSGATQIRIASGMVENQDTALHFYTTILGFVKSKDIPMGPTFRWLTVSASEGAQEVELLNPWVSLPPKHTKTPSSPPASPPPPSSPTTSNPSSAA